MLDQLMGDVLIGRRRRRRTWASSAYLARETRSGCQPVTDADIRAFYDQNKDRTRRAHVDELSEPNPEFLQGQRRQQARASWSTSCGRRDANVTVMLEPPRYEVPLAEHDPVRGEPTAPVTHRRVLRLPVTVLREGRSDPHEGPRDLRQQGPHRLQGLPAAQPRAGAEGGRSGALRR